MERGSDNSPMHKWTGLPCPKCGYEMRAVKSTGFTFCSNHGAICDYEVRSDDEKLVMCIQKDRSKTYQLISSMKKQDLVTLSLSLVDALIKQNGYTNNLPKDISDELDELINKPDVVGGKYSV